MSAGEPLDTSLGMSVFIPPTQSSDLNLPQQAEFRPRPAPQDRSLCPKSAFWSKRRWSSSFRSPCSGDQASGFQTRGLFLSLSVDVAPPLLPGSGSEPQMGGARPGSPEAQKGAAAGAARSARVGPASPPPPHRCRLDGALMSSVCLHSALALLQCIGSTTTRIFPSPSPVFPSTGDAPSQFQ